VGGWARAEAHLAAVADDPDSPLLDAPTREALPGVARSLAAAAAGQSKKLKDAIGRLSSVIARLG
jgi:hypothetical protein